jgi:hypothetical protein
VHACDLPEKYDALTQEFSDRVRVHMSHLR